VRQTQWAHQAPGIIFADVVAKDNDLDPLEKEKEKLQEAYNRAQQRTHPIEGIL